MFSFFYPENGQKAQFGDFETKDDAIRTIKNRGPNSWQEIKAHKSGDIAAFMHVTNGDIVVLREILMAHTNDAL